MTKEQILEQLEAIAKVIEAADYYDHNWFSRVTTMITDLIADLKSEGE